MSQQELKNPSAPYDAIQIANHIIVYCNAKGLDMNLFRLQRVLFFCQCYCLKKNDNILFKDTVEKTLYGVIIRQVNDLFNGYGIADIKRTKDYVNLNRHYVTYNEQDISKEDRQLINEVVNELKDISTVRLINVIQSLPSWKEKKQELENGNYNLEFSITEMKLVF